MQTFSEFKTDILSNQDKWGTAERSRVKTDRNKFISSSTHEERNITDFMNTLRAIERTAEEGLATLQIKYPISVEVKDTLKEMGYKIEDLGGSDYIYISW